MNDENRQVYYVVVNPEMKVVNTGHCPKSMVKIQAIGFPGCKVVCVDEDIDMEDRHPCGIRLGETLIPKTADALGKLKQQ